MMRDFRSECRGSAVQWFALAAAVLSVVSLAGAHGLDWLSQSGRIALVADRGTVRSQRVAAAPDVDPMPTGAIPASRALVIRIR